MGKEGYQGPAGSHQEYGFVMLKKFYNWVAKSAKIWAPNDLTKQLFISKLYYVIGNDTKHETKTTNN